MPNEGGRVFEVIEGVAVGLAHTSAAREAWAAPGYESIDPETFTVEPLPVTDFGDE